MTTDTVGGVWTYSLELARALADRDVDVWLAAMGACPSSTQAREAAAIDGLELIVGEYALEWMTDPWIDVDAAAAWLLDLEHQLAVDLVHVNGYAHAAASFASPVVLVGHSCVCSWWRAVHGVEAPPAWDRYRHRVAAGLAAADEIVAPTAAILTAILDSYPVAPRGRVIPNGLDPARYVIAPKLPIVLSAGRLWDAAKNLESLAASARQVPWPVLVAGPTRHPDSGNGDARDADADAEAPNVQRLGALPPFILREHMSRAAIFALPARYEPFGLSILEAALSGCALVLGDIDSLRELWDGAAVFVPPDDPAALSAALLALARDAGQRVDVAIRCHRRAARYGSARMASAYRQLYDEILARPRVARRDAGARA